MNTLKKCAECQEYTLDETHRCGEKTIRPQPAKYNPDDPYAKYRRIAKKREGII